MKKNQKPRIQVTDESATGLNRRFIDTHTGENLTRGEFADRIEKGQYPDYHIMIKDRKRIPRSNPNKDEDDNLG